MKRNRGTTGPKAIALPAITGGIFELHEAYSLSRTSEWPKVVQVISVTPSTYTPNEGDVFTVNVALSGATTGQTLYYSILGVSGTVNASDFADGSLTGSFTASSETAGSFTKTCTARDGTEAGESFVIEIRSQSSSGPLLATTAAITPVDVTGYTLTSGYKAPVYGSGGSTVHPPSGWTGLQNASVDDGSLAGIVIPSFYFNNTAWTQAFVGSNTYITFSGGSSNYSGLSAANPALNKFMFGASDNSYQRVSTYVSGTDYTRIRYEGTASTSGALGSPNIVYEATFFNSDKTGGMPTLEVLFGQHGRTNGVTGIATPSSFMTTFTIAANTSYVFVGNAVGTSWTVYSGYHMSGTGY